MIPKLNCIDDIMNRTRLPKRFFEINTNRNVLTGKTVTTLNIHYSIEGKFKTITVEGKENIAQLFQDNGWIYKFDVNEDDVVVYEQSQGYGDNYQLLVIDEKKAIGDVEVSPEQVLVAIAKHELNIIAKEYHFNPSLLLRKVVSVGFRFLMAA